MNGEILIKDIEPSAKTEPPSAPLELCILNLPTNWATVEVVPHPYFLDLVAAPPLAEDFGKILTHLTQEEVAAFVRDVEYVFSDFDGTQIQSGGVEFGSAFLHTVAELERKGVVFVGATGKPRGQLQVLHQNMCAYDGDKPKVLRVLAEKGAFLATLESNGNFTYEPHLVSDEIVQSIKTLKGEFERTLKRKLEEEFSAEENLIRLEFAGDASHEAIFAVDIFDQDLPEDFRHPRHGSRLQFKPQDESIVFQIRDALVREVANLNLPGIGTKPLAQIVGTASVEISAGKIEKGEAIDLLCEKLKFNINAKGMFLGDSSNDKSAYERFRAPNTRAVHVLHHENCKHSEAHLGGMVDFFVMGAAHGASFLAMIAALKPSVL